jgi:signal transduction histidine kinase
VATMGVPKGILSAMSSVLSLPRTPRELGRQRDADGRAHPWVKTERLRIARELHDVVAYFATISMRAGVAEEVVDEQPEQAAEALRAIKAASKEVLREVRGILDLLREAEDGPPAGPGRGLEGLESLASTVSAAGVPTRIVVAGTPRPLPPGVERAAYRIVQESLTNVLRHAGDASAWVTVGYEGDRLVVEVADDGSGAAGGGGADGSGYGLIGIRERALSVGGEADAGPRPQGGFHVRASLPLRPR